MKVQCIIDIANEMLSQSTGTKDERVGVMRLLESILHDTGNYAGFTYLEKHEVPANELPGMQSIKDNDIKDMPMNEIYDKRFENTDSTRLRYY